MEAISRLRILHYASCSLLFDRLLESFLQRLFALVSRRFSQDREHCGFLGAETFYARRIACKIERSCSVLIENGGMHVTVPTYRDGVAEPLRHRFNRGDNVLFSLPRRPESLELAQRGSRQ